MRDRGINHRLVTPHWPQANGEAESFMKPLGKAVKAAKMEGKDWKAGYNIFCQLTERRYIVPLV